MSEQKLSIGRIVHYRLSQSDADAINRRRTDGASIFKRMQADPVQWPAGAQAHIGNTANAGEVVPAIVTRIWSEGMFNGQAFLDGNDALWITSVHEQASPDEFGVWFWPPRV